MYPFRLADKYKFLVGKMTFAYDNIDFAIVTTSQ